MDDRELSDRELVDPECPRPSPEPAPLSFFHRSRSPEESMYTCTCMYARIFELDPSRTTSGISLTL